MMKIIAFFLLLLSQLIFAPSEYVFANESEYDRAGFVELSSVIPDVILDIRYYSTDNFVGNRINGYNEPIALTTIEVAEALKKVSDEVRASGYKLLIYDAYRPQTAVDYFFEWAKKTDDIRMKSKYYPEKDKEDLFDEGFIAIRSAHSRGSAVDLSLYDIKAGHAVDMGGQFDYFGDKSFFNYINLTEEQIKNRRYLRDVMERNGFIPLDNEWWHFQLENEPYPDIYFDFPVEKNAH